MSFFGASNDHRGGAARLKSHTRCHVRSTDSDSRSEPLQAGSSVDLTSAALGPLGLGGITCCWPTQFFASTEYRVRGRPPVPGPKPQAAGPAAATTTPPPPPASDRLGDSESKSAWRPESESESRALVTLGGGPPARRRWPLTGRPGPCPSHESDSTRAFSCSSVVSRRGPTQRPRPGAGTGSPGLASARVGPGLVTRRVTSHAGLRPGPDSPLRLPRTHRDSYY